MIPYELMLIFDPGLGEEKIGQIISKIEDKIKSLGAEHKNTDKWGAKSLMGNFRKAKKLQQGYYVVIYFDSQPALPASLQAYLKVSENIVRYSIYKALPKEEKPLAEIQGVPLGEGEVIATPAEEGETAGG